MEVSISNLKVNENGKIIKVISDIHLRRRLYEFGLFAGQLVYVLSISPLKNTFIISVNGYALALRKSILDAIFVEKL